MNHKLVTLEGAHFFDRPPVLVGGLKSIARRAVRQTTNLAKDTGSFVVDTVIDTATVPVDIGIHTWQKISGEIEKRDTDLIKRTGETVGDIISSTGSAAISAISPAVSPLVGVLGFANVFSPDGKKQNPSSSPDSRSFNFVRPETQEKKKAGIHPAILALGAIAAGYAAYKYL